MSASETWTDVLTVGMSAAALIVAVLAVYLGSMKRADIWLALVPSRPPHLRVNQSSVVDERRVWPAAVSLDIPVVVANSGARPGVVTDIALEYLEEVKARPVLFIEYGPLPRSLTPTMQELEGGSVRQYQFEVPLPYSFPLSVEAGENLAALERLLEGKERLDVTIRYTYVKGRSFLPTRRRTTALAESRHLRFGVDLRSLSKATWWLS